MRRRAFDRDWTKGSIIGNLWGLSWPILITQSLNMVGPFVDMIWVGRLGAASIAGVGVSALVVVVIDAMVKGFSGGMRAMIARFVGAGDTNGANHVARQGFVVSAAFAMVVAAIGIFLAEAILILFGLEADVVAEGAAYMRVMFVGSAARSFVVMAEGVMEASGDTVTPMRIAVFVRLFHVALVPFLVFGWWLFPHLGVSGAALSNVISESLGLALMSWVLFSGRTRLRLTLRNFRLDPSIIWRILKIGLPASVRAMQVNISHLVLMRILVPFGTLAVAAQSLVARIDSFIRTPGRGLGQGAGILVGQNLGAGQPKRAERSGWLTAGFVEAITVGGPLAMLLWPESIIGIFSPEPDVVEIASTFLRIAAVGYLVQGIETVLEFCIHGAGDTLPIMVIVLVGMWVVALPLAFFLPRVTNLGVYGVPWGTVVGQLVMAVATTTYFKVGRWKRKRV